MLRPWLTVCFTSSQQFLLKKYTDLPIAQFHGDKLPKSLEVCWPLPAMLQKKLYNHPQKEDAKI
jgi:hypothetical protein